MATLALILAVAAQAADASPDLILYNARIFTASVASPFVEAVAIKGERIVATGSSRQVSALASTHTVQRDLHGRVVIPGINDAHYHHFVQPAGLRLPLQELEPLWKDVETEVSRAVAIADRGTFLFGTVGAKVFDDPRANRQSLDTLAPDNPVVLSGWTGHFYILNSAALRALGISENVPDPVGGHFVRSAQDGTLTGVALEYAAFQLHRRISELVTEQDALQQTREFIQTLLRFGITTVQNMSIPLAPQRLAALFRDAPTPVRMRIMTFSLTDSKGRITSTNRGRVRTPSPLVTVSGTKWVLDGTPIERSCAMRQPYTDRPADSGTMDFNRREMEAMLHESLVSGDQLIVHIVCDRTTEIFLNAMEATGGPRRWAERRVRIEHGDGLAPDLLARARRLGIVVVQNPTHLGLRELLFARWGSGRMQQLEPLRSLLDAGIPLAFGSDGPLNPFLNIMMATTDPARPDQAISREQAVTAYTRTSAYAQFAEKEKGTIEPGKLADLAVLSQDIFAVPTAELPKIESVLTMVGGKVVYDRLSN